eukprot:scpid100426/ scgid21288/ 
MVTLPPTSTTESWAYKLECATPLKQSRMQAGNGYSFPAVPHYLRRNESRAAFASAKMRVEQIITREITWQFWSTPIPTHPESKQMFTNEQALSPTMRTGKQTAGTTATMHTNKGN